MNKRATVCEMYVSNCTHTPMTTSSICSDGHNLCARCSL